MAALRGLCCALINESTVAAGIESFFFSVSACWAEHKDELIKKNAKSKKETKRNGIARSRTLRRRSFCPGLLSGDLIHRDVHLPKDIVEFIQRVVFNIDLSAAIAAVF